MSRGWPKFALFSDDTEPDALGRRKSRPPASASAPRAGRVDQSEKPIRSARRWRSRCSPPACSPRLRPRWPPTSPTEAPSLQEPARANPAIIWPALIASADRDTASAEAYYREALRIDPRNPDLLERTFAAALSNGDEQSADMLAERLLTRDPTNNLARLATAVHAIQQGQYAAARAQLDERRPSIERCDDGAFDRLVLRRSKRPAPCARYARSDPGSVGRRLSRL